MDSYFTCPFKHNGINQERCSKDCRFYISNEYEGRCVICEYMKSNTKGEGKDATSR